MNAGYLIVYRITVPRDWWPCCYFPAVDNSACLVPALNC